MNRSLLAVLLVGILPGAQPLFSAEAAAPLGVAVGIPPVGFLVDRIGGDRVSVQTLSPGGQCVHQLALSPKQTMSLGKARLFFTIGMPFETQLEARLRSTATRVSFVDAAAGIKRRSIDGAEACTHAHAPGETCSHAHGSADDPHIWLSPSLLKTMAGNIARALAEADADHADKYRENYRTLAKEIDEAATRVASVLEPLRGKTVYVYHPSLGYLLDSYEITQVAVEVGGKPPSAKELRELIKRARADGAKAILVEQQSDTRAADTVAKAIGCTVVSFDPLAYDAIANLEAVANMIAAGK